jgi:nitrite reductase/ring-hydroxylating ferredoxin subunit
MAPEESLPSGAAGTKASGGAGGASVGGASGNPSASGGYVTGGAGAGGNPSASGGYLTGGAGAGGNPSGTGGGFGGSLGGAGSGGTAGAVGNANPGVVVGNVSAIALGSFSIVGGIFFMGRDAGGIYAMSMQCTHKFCALDMVGNELDCPCHASRFDRTGKVLAGPATTPLPYYAVYVDSAGNISVDRFTVVSSSIRVKV